MLRPRSIETAFSFRSHPLGLFARLAIAVAVPILVAATGCAALSSYPTQSGVFEGFPHGSAVEEWAPHRGMGEWWYVTGVLEDERGEPCFFQFTVFHGRAGRTEGYMLHLAATASGEHRFIERRALPGKRVGGDADRVSFGDSFLELMTAGGEPVGIRAVGKSNGLSFDIMGRLAKPPVWHGDEGIVVMGRRDDPNERSYYYSFTSIPSKGVLTLGDKTYRVSGSLWLDRQWGTFTNIAWDWFSLRLLNGEEYMAFGFPKEGTAFATRVGADGAASAADRVSYDRLGLMSVVRKDVAYSLGWKLRIDDEEFTIVPLAAGQVNSIYWEGICEVRSPSGEFLGYCVTETTERAQ